MFSKFALLAALVATALANPIFLNTVVHDQRTAAPDGFAQTATPPAEQTIKLRVGLHQNNIAGLEDAVMAVSMPGNALYGQHLTKEQVGIVDYPLRIFLLTSTSRLRLL